MSPAESKIILKKSSRFWPIVLFPHYQKSHTAAYTGRRFLKDVKFSLGFATIVLTEQWLRCRLIFPRFLMLEVQLRNILRLTRLEGKEEILEIRFSESRLGWLTRFALSGAPAVPRDRILLNLGTDTGKWFQELNSRIGAHLETKENLTGLA